MFPQKRNKYNSFIYFFGTFLFMVFFIISQDTLKRRLEEIPGVDEWDKFSFDDDEVIQNSQSIPDENSNQSQSQSQSQKSKKKRFVEESD